MTSFKLGFSAFMMEVSAWSGISLLDTGDDIKLSWYLVTHLLASALLSLAASTLLPAGGTRQRLPLLLLMTSFSYAVPVAGFIGVLFGTLLLRMYHAPDKPPEFESARLPDFDPHQRPSVGFRQAGLRSFLSNSDVPMNSRMGAMVALQYVSGRVSSPLLRDVLSDPSEDLRLLAYGMLDNQEKRINRAIDEELKIFATASQDATEAPLNEEALTAAQRLSDLYWELVYQELALGDLRHYAIKESLRYCQLVLQQQADNAALELRHGRLLHGLGQSTEADAAYQRAIKLGLPAIRVLPYQAELCFEQRNFAEARRLMQELTNWGSLPRLRPIIDYWAPTK